MHTGVYFRSVCSVRHLLLSDGFLFLMLSGLRHIAILKLVGTEMADMGGVLELYPINGKDCLQGTASRAVSQENIAHGNFSKLTQNLQTYRHLIFRYFTFKSQYSHPTVDGASCR